ncbi:MAG: MaoC family dehydratase [Chloroflexi bacterium]|nr:MaoC family dehydratase [Chloroflexota bacterium]
MAFATLDDIPIGESASMTRTVPESDVYNFCGMVADPSPIHVDEEFGKQTRFGGRVVPGVLLGSYCLGALRILGERMRLRGTPIRGVLISTTFRFVTPTHIGDTVTLEAKYVEKFPERNRYKTEMKVTNQRGDTVLVGEFMSQLV